MHFSSFVSLAIAVVPTVFGQGIEVGVHCGTTDDATFSDCQALVDPDTWNSAFATDNVCHYTNPITQEIDAVAYNVGCNGNCCVYVARMNQDELSPNSEQIRNEASGLFGCADTSVNRINAMQQFEDTHGTCISNGNGCGDCFDDVDFS